MKRTTLNFIIDATAFVGVVFLVATGLLLHFVLPAGSGGLHATGAGWRAAERPVTLLWGLTRHEWGAVHFWIALGLMAILTAHLALHWKWIVCMVKGVPRSGSGMRVALGLLGLVSLLAVALGIFFGPTTQIPRWQLEQMRTTAP